MNHQDEKLLFSKIPRFFAAAVLLLVISAVSSYAQATDTMSISALKNDIRYTEWQMKNLRQSRKPSSRDKPIAWQQAREDFLSLQMASDELQKTAGSSATLDYSLLKDLAKQIKKCAVRLKRSLPLPAPEKGSEDLKSEDESFEAAVKTLDEAVIRFTGNPVFKNALVVDLNGGAQAGRDLQTIIALSENLKKRLAAIPLDKQLTLARREKQF